MWDYTYIDSRTDEIVLVCLCVSGFSEADNQFNDVIGVWPWTIKPVYMRREKTSIKEAIDLDEIYILE